MRAADSSAADLRGGGGRRGALARPAMKAPEHGEEGEEEGAAPPGWLVKEGTAALGGLLSEPALEHAVAQLFDVLQRAAGEQKDVADDLLRIAMQVSVAALNGGNDAANVERHIDDIAAFLLKIQSYWYACTPSRRRVMPSCYLGMEAIAAAIQAALDAREEAQEKAYRYRLVALCLLMSAYHRSSSPASPRRRSLQQTCRMPPRPPRPARGALPCGTARLPASLDTPPPRPPPPRVRRTSTPGRPLRQVDSRLAPGVLSVKAAPAAAERRATCVLRRVTSGRIPGRDRVRHHLPVRSVLLKTPQELATAALASCSPLRRPRRG
jgi:hypothetical protein